MAGKRACQRACRVIAVSNYVRSFLEQQWKIEPEKIGVVYHGVEQPPPNPRRPERVAAGIEGRFFFTAGSIRPARGLEDAVKAMALIQERSAFWLVIGGAAAGNLAYIERIRELANILGVADRIVWAGQLGPEEMSWCYRHCAAFVMTSRVEACPNVVLEALAHSCIGISSDAPPMPEFFKDSGIYYAGGDEKSLAARMNQVLESGGKLEHLRTAALERSCAFSWQVTASRTVDELERTIR